MQTDMKYDTSASFHMPLKHLRGLGYWAYPHGSPPLELGVKIEAKYKKQQAVI